MTGNPSISGVIAWHGREWNSISTVTGFTSPTVSSFTGHETRFPPILPQTNESFLFEMDVEREYGIDSVFPHDDET
jgi:hypothetical protein